jgi:hypothetical protein
MKTRIVTRFTLPLYRLSTRARIPVKTPSLIAALLFAASFSSHSTAQEDNSAADSEDVEVVEVYGSKPLFYWKEALANSRAEIIDYLNESINNEDFQLTCRKVSIPNSNFKKRECRTGYDKRIRREKFIEGLFFGGTYASAQQSAELGSTELGKKHEEHVQIVQQLYVEDEQFRQMYDKLQQIEKGYQEAHNKTFGSLSQYDEKSEESSN